MIQYIDIDNFVSVFRFLKQILFLSYLIVFLYLCLQLNRCFDLSRIYYPLIFCQYFLYLTLSIVLTNCLNVLSELSYCQQYFKKSIYFLETYYSVLCKKFEIGNMLIFILSVIKMNTKIICI